MKEGYFKALNPYNRRVIKGSILKIEDDNYDPSLLSLKFLYIC